MRSFRETRFDVSMYAELSRCGARRVGLALLAVSVAGCAPRLRPLAGAPAPAARLPTPGIPIAPTKLVFDWQLDDPDFAARGDGVARIVGPDSARLDFFVAGGLGNGVAVLIGDQLRAPGPDFVRRLVPPPPLLWAALGRLAVPPERDTVARVDGELLRADIGMPVRWRVTFRGDSLVRLERVDGDRILEWVERTGGRLRYRHETSKRLLTLTIARTESSPPFDASIWRL